MFFLGLKVLSRILVRLANIADGCNHKGLKSYRCLTAVTFTPLEDKMSFSW